MTWKVQDPAKTIERCQARIQQSEAMLFLYEHNGLPALMDVERRRIAGLKATITRMKRRLGG